MNTDLTSTLSTALSGLQVGINKARSAAGEVTKLTIGSEAVRETIKPLLDLQQKNNEASIASKIIKTENDMLGRFIDVNV